MPSKLLSKFAQFSPRLFGFLYLAAIPIFAGVYLCISDEFYAPYARYEPNYLDDKAKVAEIIKHAIGNALRVRTRDSMIRIKDWELDHGTIAVSEVNTDGSLIDFTAHVMLKRPGPNQSTSVLPLELPVTFSSEGGQVVRTSGYNRSWPNTVRLTTSRIGKTFTERQELALAAYTEIFKSYGESVVVDEAIALSRSAISEIALFAAGARGNAASVSGTVPRMFYFSAIAMTTVGFGDIVPLTTRARAIVAFQALLGIVLAGLFLNAAAASGRLSAKKN